MIIFFVIFSFLLLWCPGYFIWRKMEMGLQKILLIVVSSIMINQYLLMVLGLGIKGQIAHIIGILGLSMLWGMILIFVLLKNEDKDRSIQKEARPNKNSLALIWLLVCIVIVISAVPRIDLLMDRSTSSDASIAISSVHDDIKHIAVLSGIKEHGIVTPNPFFAEENLKYYTAYYILPAAISSAFDLANFPVWFFWTMLTNILWILSMFLILTKITKNTFVSFIIVIFSLIMGGLDILPTLYYQTFSYIEAWNGNIGRNIQIPTPYMYLIFLPQHIFAITAYILLSFLLLFENGKKSRFAYMIMGVVIALIAGNSVYVGLFSLVLLLLHTLFVRSSIGAKMINILFMGIGLFIGILPLLPLLLGNEGGMNLSYPTLTALTTSPSLQILLSLTLGIFIEFGWLMVGGILGIICILKKNRGSERSFASLQIMSCIAALLLTHFISSKFYNDWGMKGSIFILISLIFLSAYCLKNKPNRIFLFLPLMLIGTVTFALTIFQLYKPYIYLEKGASEALQYAKENTPKDAIILGDMTFYNSLIPAITDRSTIVSSLSPEANAIAEQKLFLDTDKKLQKLFTTTSIDEFNRTATTLNKNYVFIIKNTNTNYVLFSNSQEYKYIYTNNQYTLFSY